MSVASAAGFRFNGVQAQTAPQAELLGAVTGLFERVLESQDAAKAKLSLLKATVVATNREFDSEIHREWANEWVIEGDDPKYWATYVSEQGVVPLYIGVAYHPWMHISGYHPNRTLNTAEIEALERFYTERHTTERHTIPFPDTPRLAITSSHEDGFGRIVRRANRDPDEYRLHYARYYVMWQLVPRPLIA